MVTFLNATVVNVALPAIGTTLGADTSEFAGLEPGDSYVADILPGLVGAGGLLAWLTISDRALAAGAGAEAGEAAVEGGRCHTHCAVEGTPARVREG